MPDKDKKTIKKNLEWFQQDWCNPKSKYYGWEDGREAQKAIQIKHLLRIEPTMRQLQPAVISEETYNRFSHRRNETNSSAKIP